jgi:tannase/feruloyl esterase
MTRRLAITLLVVFCVLPASADAATCESLSTLRLPNATILSAAAQPAGTSGTVDRTRPLCAYPEVARYTGTGSTDEAANFVCRMP